MNDDEYPYCPSCGGVGFWLGQLGILTWFRCRDCGGEFSQENGR